jgi:hypothetical protein
MDAVPAAIEELRAGQTGVVTLGRVIRSRRRPSTGSDQPLFGEVPPGAGMGWLPGD